MTTFKRGQAPEQAAFIEAMRNDEPVCECKVTYFKLNDGSTAQGRSWDDSKPQ
jgi:hypothetical protein